MSVLLTTKKIIKEQHPDLANEFFKSANYLNPFGILVLKKIKKIYEKNINSFIIYCQSLAS